MAISVDWGAQIINVHRTDMTLVQSSPFEVRSLDIEDLHLALKDLEDNADGMTFLDTHRNSPPTTIAGVTLARVIEIINGYTITFEDGLYAVNITGGNSNIGDVVNKNSVSVNTANSAGVVQVGGAGADPWATQIPDGYVTGSAGRVLVDSITAAQAAASSAAALAAAAVTAADLAASNAAAVSAQLLDDQYVDGALTMRQAMRVVLASLTGKCTRVGNTYRFRDAADTKDRIVADVEGYDRISVTVDGT